MMQKYLSRTHEISRHSRPVNYIKKPSQRLYILHVLNLSEGPVRNGATQGRVGWAKNRGDLEPMATRSLINTIITRAVF